jgi:putative phosphonate metabolism protein
MTARYALYYAPRLDEPLAAFAARWLGRDPERNHDVIRPEYDGLVRERQAAVVAEPRRYGFHGTLKAPFALTPVASANALLEFAAVFARQWTPFAVPRLRLAVLGDFIALVPAQPVPALDRLAADCVQEFDRFRAAPDEAERARRRRTRLSARQEVLLARWGYPYVLDEFKFHLTLTGSLAEPERQTVYRILEPLTARFRAAPLLVRDLAVFAQDDGATAFRVLARFPFAAAAA